MRGSIVNAESTRGGDRLAVGLAGKSTYEGQILGLLNSGKQADTP